MKNSSQKIILIKVIGNFRAASFYRFLPLAFCLLFSTNVFAQVQLEDMEPPPLKLLSKAESSQLEAVVEIKPRTKLALELMEARLVKAENFGAREEYREMFGELGGFHALVDNTLDFLKAQDTDSSKVLNNFKRIELSLRKYITRLELIRRDLPIRYELYVRRLVRYIRDARTKAVEPLFDDTVVPENKPK
jgi:hypothetical protein